MSKLFQLLSVLYLLVLEGAVLELKMVVGVEVMENLHQESKNIM
jgi:hypothetical protein